MQILSTRMEPGGAHRPAHLAEPGTEPAAAPAVGTVSVVGPTTLLDAAPGPVVGESGTVSTLPVADPGQGRADRPVRSRGRNAEPETGTAQRAAPDLLGGPGGLALPGVGILVSPAIPAAIVPSREDSPPGAISDGSRKTSGHDLAMPRSAPAPTGVWQRPMAPQSDGPGFAAWLAALIAESVPDRAAVSRASVGAPGSGVSPASSPPSGNGHAARRQDVERASPTSTSRSGSVESLGVEPAPVRAAAGRPVVDSPPDSPSSVPALPDAAGAGPGGGGVPAGSEVRRPTSGSPAAGTPAVPVDLPGSVAGPATRTEAAARNRPESRTASARRLDPSAVPQPSLPESPALLHAPSPSARSDGDAPAAAAPSVPTDADRLLAAVAERIRLAIRDRLPTLEATFHDPTLGSVRLAVRGLPDGPIEAVVVVATEAAARGLERAAREADRRSADPLGIELRIRVEPASSAPVTADARPEHRAPGHAGVHDGLGQGGPSGDQTSARRDPAGADAGLGADDGGRQGDPSTPEGPVGPSGSARRGRSTGPTTAPLAGPSRGSVAARSGGIDIRL